MKKSGLITWGTLLCVGLLWVIPGVMQFAMQLPVWIYLAAIVVANFFVGYVLIKKPSQGILAKYLFEVENIGPKVSYVFNVGFLALFLSWERLNQRVRFVVWPLGVIPGWFAVIFIVFQFAFIGLVWWMFLR